MTADRVPVLMYHRVDRSVDAGDRRYAVSAALFAEQMAWLSDHDWQPCSMAAFAAWHQGEAPLPARSVLITFDDGFSGVHEHVMPELCARGWPATVFLVSSLIGGKDTWMSSEPGPRGRHALLDRHHIAEMSGKGFDFHSHSAGHADLTQLVDHELVAQVAGSRLALQDLLGTAVEHFAYPFGRHDERVRAAVVQAGYELGFSVNPGFNRPRGDGLAVRRLDVTGYDTPARFGRKLTYGSNDGSWAQPWRYWMGRVEARLGKGVRP